MLANLIPSHGQETASKIKQEKGSVLRGKFCCPVSGLITATQGFRHIKAYLLLTLSPELVLVQVSETHRKRKNKFPFLVPF